MTILPLDRALYTGKPFSITYTSNGYYDLVQTKNGFSFRYRPFEKPVTGGYDDCFFSKWLEAPVAYGAFENGTLLGYVEGTIESWNNRYRISNIGIFAKEHRHHGLGTLLMDTILAEARKSGARMAVLETQTCNETAIAFYRKQGFSLIGFDLYAYTNTDPERHEIRIEMGKML